MKRKTFLLIISAIGMMMTACGSDRSGSNNPRSSSESKGENLGLVLIWTIDDGEASQGTAPFDLYYDNGNYYVDFYGEMCKLREIEPIYIDDTKLCYLFTTSKMGPYTYYLTDVADSSIRFFSN